MPDQPANLEWSVRKAQCKTCMDEVPHGRGADGRFLDGCTQMSNTEPAAAVVARVLRCAGILLPNDPDDYHTYDQKIRHLAADVLTALSNEQWTLMRPVTAEEEAGNVW